MNRRSPCPDGLKEGVRSEALAERTELDRRTDVRSFLSGAEQDIVVDAASGRDGHRLGRRAFRLGLLGGDGDRDGRSPLRSGGRPQQNSMPDRAIGLFQRLEGQWKW